jgi:hypothetical protein
LPNYELTAARPDGEVPPKPFVWCERCRKVSAEFLRGR